MLPSPGWEDILPAKSKVSEEDGTKEGELPGAASMEGEDVGASMGRRGLRREIDRLCEGKEVLDEC